MSNMTANPQARLALGESRDVVMIDAVLIEAIPASDAPATLAEGYAAQAGWDPRTDPANYVYVVLGPERIQVWGKARAGPAHRHARRGMGGLSGRCAARACEHRGVSCRQDRADK